MDRKLNLIQYKNCIKLFFVSVFVKVVREWGVGGGGMVGARMSKILIFELYCLVNRQNSLFHRFINR